MLDDETTPVFVISVAAQLAGLHPQTLRTYDRLGIVSPERTPGGGRRYSARDIQVLRQVQQLSQEGINLAGIKRILALENEVAALRRTLAELRQAIADLRDEQVSNIAGARGGYRHELMPLPETSRALLAWQPRRVAPDFLAAAYAGSNGEFSREQEMATRAAPFPAAGPLADNAVTGARTDDSLPAQPAGDATDRKGGRQWTATG